MFLHSDIFNSKDRQKFKVLTIISFVSLIFMSFIVIQILEFSNYAGTMDDTQLGFNGEIIKNYFALMSNNELNLFLLANLIDYLFMISYALFFFSSAKFLAWNYKNSKKKLASFFAWMGIFAAVSDALENVFIISMVLNPVSFPLWLAIGHSSFAVIKFILMFLVFLWILFSCLINIVIYISKFVTKRKFSNSSLKV